MAPRLQARGLYKIFGSQPETAMQRLRAGETKEQIFAETGLAVGVQDVSFSVEEGSIFVVMGLSGSGKSTLVRLLNGLIQPTAGEVLLDGEDVAGASPARLRAIRRDKIAMVFQNFALFPHMTVAGNAAFGLKVKGIGAAERRSRAIAALELVGLEAWADSYPGELSGGMQQRAGLARALATDPEVLLMDEPFGALDPLIRREVQGELLRLQRRLGKTVVFITHDLNEALLLGDRIAIMREGRIEQIGTGQEIVEAPASEYVRAFTADIDRGRVFSAGDVAVDPMAVQLTTGTTRAALDAMERHNRRALYVMDGETVAGIVTHRDLSAAGRDADSLLPDALIVDFPSVASEAPLHELYRPASAGLPIAVVDSSEKLVGVVEPESVLAQLSRDEDRPGLPA